MAFLTFNRKLFTENLNDYELGEPINAKGTIVKATLKDAQLKCAIRKINMVDYDLELLENETEIDSMVEHPNIMKIITCFIQEDFLYTIYPLTEFPSLDIISKPFGLDEKVVAFVLRDILDAIDYLHRNNITHRAISGSNVLMFGNFQTSLKFVLSGLKYSHYDGAGNDTGLKTFDYPKNAARLLKHLAPEVLEQTILGYNFKADIYSVGILCCELANGVVPFDYMETDELLFYKIIGDTPKLLDSTCEEMKIFQELSDRLEATIKRRYMVYLKKKFSQTFHELVRACLHVEPIERPRADFLLRQHPFIRTVADRNESRRTELLSEMLREPLKMNSSFITLKSLPRNNDIVTDEKKMTMKRNES